MGLLKLFSNLRPMHKSIEFIQSKSFKGFKRYVISNYQFEEAESNIKKIKAINPKMDFDGTIIRLEHIVCDNKTEALAVFLVDMRIGTIFFNDGNYAELLQAFKEKRISAAHIGANKTDDFYLYVKLED